MTSLTTNKQPRYGLDMPILYMVASIIKEAAVGVSENFFDQINNIQKGISVLQNCGLIDERSEYYHDSFPGIAIHVYNDFFHSVKWELGARPAVYFYAGEYLQKPWDHDCWSELITDTKTGLSTEEKKNKIHPACKDIESIVVKLNCIGNSLKTGQPTNSCYAEDKKQCLICPEKNNQCHPKTGPNRTDEDGNITTA